MKRWAPLVLLVLATACGHGRAASGGAEAEEPSPLAVLVDAGKIAAQDRYQTLRYNPTGEACTCPAFEILVGGRWWRVRLSPANEDLSPLPGLSARAEVARAAGQLPSYYAVGRLDADPIVVCPNGAYGFEIVVRTVHDTPPPAPPTEPLEP